MKLDDLKVYQMSMKMGDEVWRIVSKWDYFEKDTMGKQLLRAVDSIAANLSEGFGRYHFKESKNFSYYARGSLFETKTWLTKARNRNLITETDYGSFAGDINLLGKMINTYIKSIGPALNTNTQEPDISYSSPDIDSKNE